MCLSSIQLVHSQNRESLIINPPDGSYSSWEALMSNSPMNTMKVDKVPLTKKMKKNKDFSLCKMRYNINKQMISATYAIVIDGEIFIHTATIHSKQHKHEKSYNLGIPYVYSKVAVQGRFWYLDGAIYTKDDGMMLGAILGGGIGSLIGATIDGKMAAGPVGIIYDPSIDTYSSIKKCEELEQFAIQHYTGVEYPCKGQVFTHHQVRQFVLKLNNERSDN